MTRTEFLQGIAAAVNDLTAELLPDSPLPAGLFIESRDGRVLNTRGHALWLSLSGEHRELQMMEWAAHCRLLAASRAVAVHAAYAPGPPPDNAEWDAPFYAEDQAPDDTIEVVLATGIDALGTFGMLGLLDRSGEHPRVTEWWATDRDLASMFTDKVGDAMQWRHGG